MSEAGTAGARPGAEDRVAIPGHVRFRHIDDELVIVDLAGGEYFSLNAVGAKMWDALAAGQTPAEIALSLGSAYDLAHDVFVEDCIRLVNQLVECGLATRVAR